MARQSQTRQSKSQSTPEVLAGVLAAEVAKTAQANGSAASELHEFLYALQAMRAGDFSVRMSGDHEGIAGKIADTFNEIVAANERMSKELERVGEVVGRPGQDPPPRQIRHRQRRLERYGDVGQYAHRGPALADQRSDSRRRRRRQGRPADVGPRGGRRTPAEGRIPRSATIVNTMIKQLNVFTSEVTRVAREVVPTAGSAARRRSAKSPASGRISPKP